MQITDSVLRVHIEDRTKLGSTVPTVEGGNIHDQLQAGRVAQRVRGQWCLFTINKIYFIDMFRILKAPESHWDGISDLVTLKPELLVSSGREGVIKIWKIH